MLTPTVIAQQLQTSQDLAVVWQWIGSGHGLSQWLNGKVMLEPVEGGLYEEHGEYRRGPYTLRGRVLKILPPLVLVVAYRLDLADDGRWPIYTPVELSLHRDATLTTLSIIHRGFENLPERYRDSAFADFSLGWQHALDRLRARLPD